MERTGRGSFACLALIGIIGAVVLPLAHAGGEFAGPGHPSAFALPPPDPCRLCPILDDPLVASSPLAGPETLAVEDGHRLPIASRAPPVSA